MKTTRWITVAALLCCAGNRLQAQDYGTWPKRGERTLSGPSRQLLLVHGIFSDSGTWDALTWRMYEMGDTTWHVFTPSLYSSQPFAMNRDSLVRYMVNENLANDVAVVGHSMGGLIGRLASRSHQTQGILTIGTPHYGAPLAGALVAEPWESPVTWYTGLCVMAGSMTLWRFPSDNEAWVGPLLSWYDIEDARTDTRNTVEDFLGLSLLDFAEFLRAAPAMHDLAYGSQAISELNQEYQVSREQTPRRLSITPTLDWSDYPTGPFILLGNRDAAHQMGDYIQEHGLATFIDGLALWGGADWDNDAFWTISRTGITLMALGFLEADYWYFWNQRVVGGMPNDGIVPLWSMTMPNSQPLAPPRHAMHSEETAGLTDFLLNTINAFFVH